MKTYIYMIRHGDSPKDGNERTRGLTEKGIADAQKIAFLLREEAMDAVISSPYYRSIQTVQPLAKHIGKEVVIYEDLKERIFTADDKRLPDKELMPVLQKSLLDRDFALTGGESNADCQMRAVKVLKEILITYLGQKVALGTHGAVMTLMMGYYDSKYDLTFLLHTSKPDIYKMEFDGQELVDVQKMWKNI